MFHCFSPWHGHASHDIIDLFAGENEDALGLAKSYAFDLGLLLHVHGKSASKILLASSRSGISELGFFIGLEFYMELVDSAFGVYNVA